MRSWVLGHAKLPTWGNECLSYHISQFFQSALNLAFGNRHLDCPKAGVATPLAYAVIEAPFLMPSGHFLARQTVAGSIATHLHRPCSALDFGSDMQEEPLAAFIPAGGGVENLATFI